MKRTGYIELLLINAHLKFRVRIEIEITPIGSHLDTTPLKILLLRISPEDGNLSRPILTRKYGRKPAGGARGR